MEVACILQSAFTFMQLDNFLEGQVPPPAPACFNEERTEEELEGEFDSSINVSNTHACMHAACF